MTATAAKETHTARVSAKGWVVIPASLRRHRTARDLARLDLLRAWVELGVEVGDVRLGRESVEGAAGPASTGG